MKNYKSPQAEEENYKWFKNVKSCKKDICIKEKIIFSIFIILYL